MQHFDINKAAYIDAHSFLFSLQHILLTHSFPSASFSPFLTYLLPIQLLQTCFHMKTDHGNSYSLAESSEYSIHFNFLFPVYLYTNKNNFLEKQRRYSRVSGITRAGELFHRSKLHAVIDSHIWSHLPVRSWQLLHSSAGP